MIRYDIPFKVFPGCKIVKGYRRSIIYDLNRFSYHFIPNGLQDILIRYNGSTLNYILRNFASDEHDTVIEYFTFLFEKEIIFYCDVDLLVGFSEIETSWATPSFLSNVIIDNENKQNWEIIFNQLSQVFCKHLQIRFSDINGFFEFLEFLKNNTDNCISAIEVYIPYNLELDKNKLNILLKNHLTIVRYFIYGSPKQNYLRSRFSATEIYYSKYSLEYLKSKNTVNHKSFNNEIMQFAEAHSHNIFYNRKAFIDNNGFIKMGPNTIEKFGNIYIDSLKSISQSKRFKRFWKISKDEMLKCKDCEFRYMCLFDGAPTLDKDSNLYKYATNCGYNPYLAKFE